MLIAHLSDSHITTTPLSAEPAAGLYRALGRVLALDPLPDCVVITGDLVDRGRPDEYAMLHELIVNFPLPLHLVTGNHDDRAALLATFAGTRFLAGGGRANYVVEYPEARLVALDSLTENLGHGGLLGAEQLGWLDDTLGRRPAVPAFVCLHHPPIPVGIPGMDEIRLADGDALAEVIGRHPQVVRLLTGHLHRVVTAAFAGTVMTTAPSTYRQVDLCMRAERPITFAAEPTGFLLHLLDGTGCITHTVPTSSTAAPVGW